MANNYPSLEQLIAARRTGGPAEAIQSGLEGFMAGRKRKIEEDQARAEAALGQAKLKLSQQTENREARTANAGLIPSNLSATGREATPSVQTSLEPKLSEFEKTEIEEGGKKFLLFTNKNDPTQHVKIAAGDISNKGKIPAGIAASALKTSGSGFLNEVKRIEPKLTGFAGPVSLPSARAKFGEISQGQFGGTDPDIISYEQSRDTAGRRIYKELSGDVGNIAFNEGTFAKVLVPSIYDSPGLRATKTARLDRLYKAAADARTKVIEQIKTGNFSDEQATKLIESAVNNEVQKALTESGTEGGQAVGGLSPQEQAELEQLRALKNGARR